MGGKENLNLQALESAKHYMGDFAWPTAVLGVAIFVAYLATPLLVVSGHLALLPGMLLMSLLTYAAYTVLHEAAHGTISGSHSSLRWVNELMGYLAAWVIMIPLTAHRHEHLAHHRHTNDPDKDPESGPIPERPQEALSGSPGGVGTENGFSRRGLLVGGTGPVRGGGNSRPADPAVPVCLHRAHAT